MLSNEEMFRRIDEIPIDELRAMMYKAIEDSGISCQNGPGKVPSIGFLTEPASSRYFTLSFKENYDTEDTGIYNISLNLGDIRVLPYSTFMGNTILGWDSPTDAYAA